MKNELEGQRSGTLIRTWQKEWKVHVFKRLYKGRQNSITDMGVTLLLTTDPVQGRGNSAGVSSALADSCVSLQAPDSHRRFAALHGGLRRPPVCHP